MGVLRKLLFPFSLLYGLVIAIRNRLYDYKILKSTAHKLPIICVGNLSFGGTGKTPMTEYLIRLLEEEYCVAVLSRGYKRESRGYHLAGSGTSVWHLGDEPYQYYKKFPELYVAVDVNRNRGIEKLSSLPKPPDVIILDDAFQHRRTRPGLNILLTTYARPYVNDLLFPAGNLRDAKREAGRATIIIITKCPENLSWEDRERLKRKLKLNADQQLFFTTLYYDTSLRSATGKLHIEALKSQNFTLVTGIANPLPLVNFLKGKGLVFDHINYPDHYRFSQKDIMMLKQKKMVVTTEKDYMRIQNRLPVAYYLSIRVAFLEEEEKFVNLIRQWVRKI